MARTGLVALAVLAACAVAYAAGASSSTSIVVDVGTEQVPLTVDAGVDFVDAAAAFCDHYNVDKSMNVARLVAALEKESARQNVAAVPPAQQTNPEPLVSLPLVVREQRVDLVIYPGQDAVQAVRSFAAQHGLNDDDLNYVYQAVMQELQLIQQQARIVAEVSVDIDLGNGQLRSVPMYLREGETPNEAAAAFAAAHDLPARNIPTLVGALNRQLAPRPVFTVPLVVDGTPRELTLHENEPVGDAAASFCSGFGIEADECMKVRNAILRRIQQAGLETTPPAAAAPAAAPAPAPAARPRGLVSVVVGDNTFDMEFDAGITATVLAQHFCRQQLPTVQAALARDGTASATMADCVAVLTHELSRRAV